MRLIAPRLVPRVWGGERLKQIVGNVATSHVASREPIGEAWFGEIADHQRTTAGEQHHARRSGCDDCFRQLLLRAGQLGRGATGGLAAHIRGFAQTQHNQIGVARQIAGLRDAPPSPAKKHPSANTPVNKRL